MSEQKSQLVEALIAAQKEFAPALKLSENPHFRSKFVDLATAWDAVKTALWNHGLTVLQTTDVRENGATVLVTHLEHTSGQQRISVYPLIPAKDRDPQALGAALTYARRYTLMAILGLAPEDDDGETASKKGNSEPPKAPPKASQPAKSAEKPATNGPAASASSDTLAKLQSLALDPKPAGLAWSKPHALNWLKKHFGVASSTDLSPTQLQDAYLLLSTQHKSGEQAYRTLLEQMESEGRVLAGKEAA